MADIGYISLITDGVSPVSLTANTVCAHRNFVGDTSEVRSKIVELPSGQKINIDGTSDPNTIPGDFYQDFGTITDAKTMYNACADLKGKRLTVTKTLLTSGTETCTAILKDVRVMYVHSPTTWDIRLSFEAEDDWA